MIIRRKIIGIACIAWAVLVGAAGQESTAPLPIGRLEVTTVPFDKAKVLRSATYTPSGKVLVSFADQGTVDERQVSLAIMDEDGRNLRTIFSQRIPDRPKDNGIRYMVFADNRRIFLGDFIVECAPSLDACDRVNMLPVTFPPEVADGVHIAHRWSEIIVAPDNRHIAWTTLLSDYSAVVFTGELRRGTTGYEIVEPRIISTQDAFEPDPKHPDGMIPRPVRGGEVKQFVRGGTAISLVGSVKRDLPDSIVQDLDTGSLDPITDTPGYTETTIFSPDERLGLTMTTRFSAATDLSVLGIVPRPYPASLNMGLSMFAYTYAVTGVRSSREGSVGPVLIDVAASRSKAGYLGYDLGAQNDWVFHSPMSWHPGGKRGLWMEGRRGSGDKRIRALHIPDYNPGPPYRIQPWSAPGPYSSADLSVIPGFIAKNQSRIIKVYGQRSGFIEYLRTASAISKTYSNFSDEAGVVYSGFEKTSVNQGGNSIYEARVQLAGLRAGIMDLKLTFGPLSGEPRAEIMFCSDASGKPSSYGYAIFEGKRIDVNGLRP